MPEASDIGVYLHERGRIVNSAIERTMSDFGRDCPAKLLEAMRYPLFAGGKRLRPILCLAAAELAGGDIEKAMPAAIALELVHTYSLIHDDLPAMDNDDLRRGLPTVHKVYGDAMAILVGDGLLTLAFEVIARSSIAAAKRVRLVEELARAAGAAGMVAGQVLDLEGERTSGASLDDVLSIHRNKTAKMIAAAVRMGVLAAGGPKRVLDAMTRWGECAGLAFQVADDVLDATSTPEQLGKTPGKDLTAGKTTAVSALGLARAKAYADELAEKAKDAVKCLTGSSILFGLTDFLVQRNS